MEAINKERRDIKVCNDRAAVKGGRYEGDVRVGWWADVDGGDLMGPSSSLLCVPHGTLGDANRWRCYYSGARNVMA